METEKDEGEANKPEGLNRQTPAYRYDTDTDTEERSSLCIQGLSAAIADTATEKQCLRQSFLSRRSCSALMSTSALIAVVAGQMTWVLSGLVSGTAQPMKASLRSAQSATQC